MKEIKLMLQIWWGNTPLNLETIEEILLKDQYIWQHKIKKEQKNIHQRYEKLLDGLCSAPTMIKVTACLRA